MRGRQVGANYFEALKKHFKLSATSIEIAGSAGHTQPVQVVARAVERKKSAASRNSGTEPFEQVWCVNRRGLRQEDR